MDPDPTARKIPAVRSGSTLVTKCHLSMLSKERVKVSNVYKQKLLSILTNFVESRAHQEKVGICKTPTLRTSLHIHQKICCLLLQAVGPGKTSSKEQIFFANLRSSVCGCILCF